MQAQEVQKGRKDDTHSSVWARKPLGKERATQRGIQGSSVLPPLKHSPASPLLAKQVWWGWQRPLKANTQQEALVLGFPYNSPLK